MTDTLTLHNQLLTLLNEVYASTSSRVFNGKRCPSLVLCSVPIEYMVEMPAITANDMYYGVCDYSTNKLYVRVTPPDHKRRYSYTFVLLHEFAHWLNKHSIMFSTVYDNGDAHGPRFQKILAELERRMHGLHTRDVAEAC